MGQRNALIPLKDRLLRRTDRTGECWLWLGKKTADGYGQLRIGGKTYLTHRLSYEVFVGRIPDGLVIDHLCRVHECLNPEHLEPVTAAVNTLRGNSPAILTWRTGICQRGHELAVEGAIVQYRRGREVHTCRKCVNYKNRLRRQREAREREVAVLAELPPSTDPDDPAQTYLTTEEAASAAHVRTDTIRDWDRRGLITPIARGVSNYYLELDVLKVEAETRRGPRRKQLAGEAMNGLSDQLA